jgi:spore germination cell wall hydrolase CwlJ-like protein
LKKVNSIILLLTIICSTTGFSMGLEELVMARKQPVTAMQEMANSATYNKVVLEVAKTLAAEAGGEGAVGMNAVAHVMDNRKTQWKKDIMEVISAKNQFYGYTAKNRDKIFEQVKDVALPLAEAVVNGTLGKDTTGGALYFRQPKEPIYKWHGQETTRIGGHIFHKERKK